MINIKIILKVLGALITLEGVFMLLCLPFSLWYGESDTMPILYSAMISIGTGLLTYGLNINAEKSLSKREGYIIVSLSWIVFSLFGSLPFYLSGSVTSITDAFFETMSGFTTTGASILNDIESVPHGLLFWRSMTQWLGGMGIIVLSLAILPILGIGGMQLFVAEVPGPTPDKLHPRITGTAKRLWLIYVSFTFVETILLMFGGMDFFDSINHAFTTMATGGYSTRNASVAAFDSAYIQYVIIAFMFLAGTNFTLSYFALHLNFDKIRKNEEFRAYLGFTLAFAVSIAFVLYFYMDYDAEKAIRDSLFQVVSIITTTGFVTADYLKWVPFVSVLIFLLMFFGGSAGSTGGGIKIMRVLLLIKNGYQELKRLVHPNAVIPVRLNKRAVPQQIVTNVLAFVVFYMMISAGGTVFMSMLGYDLDTSLGAVISCIGNIGPGLGEVGPVCNFSHIPDLGKWFLSFLMLIGRLELFTVIILLSPSFWRK